MRKHVSLILLLLLGLCLSSHAKAKEINIIPEPVSMSLSGGEYSYKNLSVSTSGFDRIPINLVEFARQIVSTGSSDFRRESANESALLLNLDKNATIPSEGYRLVIDKNGISITSATERGIFYGLQTLMQIMPSEGEAKSLPYMEVEDYPRFRYRGLHLDVCRYMFPIDFIKQYIDLIAQYKLNTFHWHLTEDQGWRIEIKKYPKLAEVAAYRDQTIIGFLKNKPQRFDGTRYGGYYTQEEVKEIVAYAASKYITVIPEIEMPGHAMAALSAYPELGCGDNPGPYKVAEKWGIFEDVFCAGKESTFKFLEDVLDEVLELFPSEYIHIGGDECPKAKWKTCPHCQKRIKKEKLKDEHQLQSYFISRMEKYLNKKGRQIIGWDEILEGGLAPNATVMSWRGVKGGIAAAQQHHDVIMTPNTYLYLDYNYSLSPEEPLTIGKYVPLEKTYSYDPAPKELTPEQQKYIKGVQGNLWTEYVSTPEKAFYMALPRLMALSEIAWSPLEKKNWTSFSEVKLPVHLAALEGKGINFRVPEPIGIKDTLISAASYTLNCKVPVKGATIYYTIDGYTPSEKDYRYYSPVTISVPSGEERQIKAVVITATGKRSVVVTTTVKNDLAYKTKTHAERLHDKLLSNDREYVFVIAHRGDWRNAPENSLHAIQRAIDMKVDMVEIDIQRTKDGNFVLVHDETIDRTTTGKGKVADFTTEELKRLNLRAGHNHRTSEKIATLEEALLLCKGKILVNIDKGGTYIKEILPILKRTGTENQVIIKGTYPVEKVKEEYGNNNSMLYMPIVQADKEGVWEEIDSFLRSFKPVAVELCFKTDKFEILPRFKEISNRGSRVWINTLWSSLCGGHEDDKATLDPNANWGWVLKQHATMIQTDRPQELISYLEKNGRRIL